jgi:hypothetical protein
MQVQSGNPFAEFDVVSTYSDREAVEDGTLVPITTKDRVTRSVWEWIIPKCPNTPPNCWPVSQTGYLTANIISRSDAAKMIIKYGAAEAQEKFQRKIAEDKTLAMSKGVLSTYHAQAQRAFNSGGIFKLFVRVEDGLITELSNESGDQTLWLLPNANVDGLTLMFPSDY